MRVNIEHCAWTDVRLIRLAKSLNVPLGMAIGIMAHVWFWGQENLTDTFNRGEIEALVGRKNLVEHCEKVGIATEVSPGIVRFAGLRDRLEELSKIKYNQSLRAKSRWDKNAGGIRKENAEAMQQQNAPMSWSGSGSGSGSGSKKIQRKKYKDIHGATEVASVTPKQPNEIYQLVEHWQKEYAKIYGTESLKPSGKDFAQAKFILAKAQNVDDAKNLISHFMNRKDEWFIKKGHTLETLVGNIDKMWSELKTGKITTSHEAKRQSVWEHNMDIAAQPTGPSVLDMIDQLEKGINNGKGKLLETDKTTLSGSSSVART